MTAPFLRSVSAEGLNSVTGATGATGPSMLMVPRQNQQNQPEEERIMSTVSSILPYLPAPLRLIHGPLPITIDTWSDGAVEARLPSLALAGEGETDTDAIRSLGREIAEFAMEVKAVVESGESLGGPLLERWNGLLALVDMSGLSNQ